ncbi:MAG: histidine kinase [Peptostreptococcaceae bacterium]|nr:histidine kinase [Peptostreptococcaceae bacterium]
MIMILLISRPFDIALRTVELIAFPMILLNSVGMLIFISTIKNVFQEKDIESEGKLRLALSVAEKSLPCFRKGISNLEGMTNAVSVIMESTVFNGVLITDRQQIMAKKQVGSRINLDHEKEYMDIAKQAMDEMNTLTVSEKDLSNPLSSTLEYYIIIATPLIQMEQAVGCMIVFEKRRWLRLEADISFVKGLAILFSSQLELAEVDYQKKLRHKAELYALQSQVNPHFLYNTLNTLSCICRESPHRARKLLLTMATYYRQTLDSNKCMVSITEEIEQINNYLLLEKARFEEKLEVTMDIPKEIDCLLPTLILQPIVDNAIKYGGDANGYMKIAVVARQEVRGTRITVTDCGPGFLPEILEEIMSESSSSSHIGLINVNKRMKSIFGEAYGIAITCSEEGPKVLLFIPNAVDVPLKLEGKRLQ